MGTNKLGDTLRAARKAKKLTQAQLASKAGVTQGTIGNIESGFRGYGESLVDIARVLEVSPEHLRCEKERASGPRLAQSKSGQNPDEHVEASAAEIVDLINAYRSASVKDREEIMISAKVAARRASRKRPATNQG